MLLGSSHPTLDLSRKRDVNDWCGWFLRIGSRMQYNLSDLRLFLIKFKLNFFFKRPFCFVFVSHHVSCQLDLIAACDKILSDHWIAQMNILFRIDSHLKSNYVNWLPTSTSASRPCKEAVKRSAIYKRNWRRVKWYGKINDSYSCFICKF